MQLHQIQPKTQRKTGRYVGRGGKRGKTAGRGTKGQKARAGAKFRPEIRDTIKRLPKLRGRGKNSNKGFRAEFEVTNLTNLNTAFKDGATVNPKTLLKAGLVRRVDGDYPKVKILATGELTKKLVFEDCTFSGTAKEMVLKAGGTIK